MTILAWLLAAALSASAHEVYPIRPVRATLRVEPGRIVADFRADSIYWIEEVAHLHPMPARDWPAETRAIVEDYINAHFSLTAGGAPLRGKLVSARYRQFPWEVNEEGKFFMRLVYPAAAGESLRGTARFYEEYRKELEAEFAGRPVPFADGFRTVVDIPGRRRLAFTLTPGSPSFAASVDEARRTAFAMALEALTRGAKAAAGAAAGFPVLLAAALCLGAKAPSRAHAAVLLAAGAAGFLAGGLGPAAPWLVWAALLAAALGAWLGRAEMAAPALFVLAFVWREAVDSWLPRSPMALPSALAGALAAGATMLFVAWFGVRAEHRRLAAVSEARVDELFARRAHLTATALAMVGAYGFWQSLQR